ncbi:MAG: tetratricopeptide repeat protein [Candidatus Eremiobacteraeota bacterium]|nr:tetratricopeptide repeat protein [Candidatus Eremiobacteraeota bacterium]
MEWRRINLVFACVVVAVTAFSFLPVLENGFVWDDFDYVVHNEAVQRLTWQSAADIFNPADSPGSFALSFSKSLYTPLTILSFALEYPFYGENAGGYHAGNLVLHLLNCMLVYWLILILSRKPLVSFIAALFFGIHPLHVESVAWISERKDVLYAFFYLASLIAWLLWRGGGKQAHLFLSLALFLLSLLAKPMALTLPAILFLFDYLQKRKFSASSFREKVPFILMDLIYFAFLVIFHIWPRSAGAGTGLGILQKLQVACSLVVFYLGKFIAPVNLMCVYPYPEGTTFPSLFLHGTLIFLCIASSVALAGRYTGKVPFGFLFFVLTLVPVLQLTPIPPGIAADRYTYIPFIGLLFIVAEGGALLWERSGRPQRTVLVLLLLAAAVASSSATRERCRTWADPVTLFSDLIAKNPGEAVGYLNRSEALIRKGDFDGALDDLNRVIAMGVRSDTAHADRARILFARGACRDALADLDRAVSLSPSSAAHYFNRGVCHEKLGDEDEALADYGRAVALGFGPPAAAFREGLLYGKRKDYRKARESMTEALRRGGSQPLIYLMRGEFCWKGGDTEAAEKDLTMAVGDDPAVAEKARYTLASLYRETGRLEKALACYEEIIRVNPKAYPAYEARALIFAGREDYRSAREELERLRASGGSTADPLLLRIEGAVER